MSVRSTQDAGPTLDADVERMGGAGGQWVVHASHQLRSKRTENHIQRKKTSPGRANGCFEQQAFWCVSSRTAGWRVEGGGSRTGHQSHLQMAAATGTNNDVRYCSAIPGTFKCSAKITENRIPTFQLCLVKLCLEGNSVRLI